MKTFSAIWKAEWYELDQSIQCGITDELWFVNKNGNRKFHTGVDSKENLEIINGEIISINHKYLGDITKIDARGLTYKFTLAFGKEVVIEAEETPGQIENDFPDFDTDDFIFTVVVNPK